MEMQFKIGIAGGPGSGKSTLAKLLVVALGNERKVGAVIAEKASEAPHEYARTFIDRRIKKEKLPCGRTRHINVYDQGYIMRGQQRREADLADYPLLVTDSPGFLPYVYYFEVDPLSDMIGDETRDLIRRELEHDAYDSARSYDAVLFVPPVIPFKTDPTRTQKAAEERQRISERIESFLKLYRIPYSTIRSRGRTARVRESLSYLLPLLKEKFAPDS